MQTATLISANAFFTITALVENNMAPIKVTTNPATEIFILASLTIKIKPRRILSGLKK